MSQFEAQGQNGPTLLCDITVEPFTLDIQGPIIYSYDVEWVPSDIRWSSRWDVYLSLQGDEGVHWVSIINSAMIVAILSGMVALILVKTLHRDIARYNEIISAEDAADETGWKLVHGDVFRKPPHAKLLAVCTGTGCQLLVMAFVTIIFAAMGFLSPARRGALLQACLLLFTTMGSINGYYSTRLHLTMDPGSVQHKTLTLWTALMFPGLCFAIFFLLDLFLWAKGSTGAVPFAILIALLLMWFGISVPLVFVGAYCGGKKEGWEKPVRVNQIPRQIPPQPWFLKPLVTCLIGGILPFGAVFTELYWILTSVWRHTFYYLFGCLLLTLIIMVVTCAEIAIALTYFQLTAENHHWWWRAFFASGSSAFYVMAYSMHFFSQQLQIVAFVPSLLYFSYMALVSLAFFLMTGAVGVLATFRFCQAIYGSIKID